MKKLAQGFSTAAQDLNPDSRSRESEVLPMSHCSLVIMKLHERCLHSGTTGVRSIRHMALYHNFVFFEEQIVKEINWTDWS